MDLTTSVVHVVLVRIEVDVKTFNKEQFEQEHKNSEQRRASRMFLPHRNAVLRLLIPIGEFFHKSISTDSQDKIFGSAKNVYVLRPTNKPC